MTHNKYSANKHFLRMFLLNSENVIFDCPLNNVFLGYANLILNVKGTSILSFCVIWERYFWTFFKCSETSSSNINMLDECPAKTFQKITFMNDVFCANF